MTQDPPIDDNDNDDQLLHPNEGNNGLPTGPTLNPTLSVSNRSNRAAGHTSSHHNRGQYLQAGAMQSHNISHTQANRRHLRPLQHTRQHHTQTNGRNARHRRVATDTDTILVEMQQLPVPTPRAVTRRVIEAVGGAEVSQLPLPHELFGNMSNYRLQQQQQQHALAKLTRKSSESSRVDGLYEFRISCNLLQHIYLEPVHCSNYFERKRIQTLLETMIRDRVPSLKVLDTIHDDLDSNGRSDSKGNILSSMYGARIRGVDSKIWPLILHGHRYERLLKGGGVIFAIKSKNVVVKEYHRILQQFESRQAFGFMTDWIDIVLQSNHQFEKLFRTWNLEDILNYMMDDAHRCRLQKEVYNNICKINHIDMNIISQQNRKRRFTSRSSLSTAPTPQAGGINSINNDINVALNRYNSNININSKLENETDDNDIIMNSNNRNKNKANRNNKNNDNIEIVDDDDDDDKDEEKMSLMETNIKTPITPQEVEMKKKQDEIDLSIEIISISDFGIIFRDIVQDYRIRIDHAKPLSLLFFFVM